MVDVNTLLFICLCLPMAMMLAVFKGKSRTLALFLVLGCFTAYSAAELNGYILVHSGLSRYFMTVNVTPITEELCKALPILCFAFFFKPDNQHLAECAIACGIGFSMAENTVIFAQNIGSVTLAAAIIRGLGAGMMHSICSLAIGSGVALFEWKKKWFFTGTVALFAMAVIYHALYNLLVQSAFMLSGVMLTAGTFLLIAVIARVGRRKKAAE